jgi:Glycosyltransferase family 87
MTSRQMKLRAIPEFIVVGICTVAFVFTALGICASVLGSAAGSTDFVEYWASGHQLIHRANPYDGDAILRLERSAGFPSGIPVLIMWNLPSALLLVLPLGFLGPRAGQLLWLLLLLACLTASVRMIWILHGRPKNRLDVLGYSFGPALSCLLAGQVSLFALLGLVLFLRFHRSRPLLAGVSLWLCMLKPHLFLPFGVVLVVWAIITRSYKVLIGAAVALGASTGTAFLLDPFVWTHYRQMVSMARTEATIPCLSRMLQWYVSPNTVWLPYLPAALGCVWALAYFRKHRDDWDWMEHGSPLMLVSVLVAPYTWLTDQAILIPALLHGAYLTRSRSTLAILALASAVIEVEALRGVPLLHSIFYLWTAPAWLAWYLCARRPSHATDVYDPPALADASLIPTVKDRSFCKWPSP